MSQDEQAVPKKREPVTVKLNYPVQFGTELVEELTLRPLTRCLKGLEIPLQPSGGIIFRPYELARAGLEMAGKPAGLLDKLDPSDMREVAEQVLVFLGHSPTTGSDTSP